MEVTLDTNAVIALANDEPGARFLKPLRDYYHKQGLITLSVGRTAFLEAIPRDVTESELIFAEKRIAAAGLNIEGVQLDRAGQIMAYRCLKCNAITYGHEHDMGYMELIHTILKGKKEIDRSYYEYRKRRSNDPEEIVQKVWHNHFNDVLGLFEHISWGGDIFVTSDRDFLTKRTKLARVVPGKILNYEEALETLSAMSLPVPKTLQLWQPRIAIRQCTSCYFKQQSAS